LTNARKGTLDPAKTSLTGTAASEEQFSLDKLGNWTHYLTQTNGATTLDQTRTHNAANEMGTITTTTGSAWTSSVHDAAGNMINEMADALKLADPDATSLRLFL